ncbi:hypothetical protein HYC85_027817 [Camellia sinensis]|uniref:Bidirectional sugar transporter SWEET n=1 Tax=Camellia sinensis TaxID=4442 RepID=A0A7J7FXC4_CAMSI|nr:hypothetical protein HYC85_027817 [Camellia sinensis]
MKDLEETKKILGMKIKREKKKSNIVSLFVFLSPIKNQARLLVTSLHCWLVEYNIMDTLEWASGVFILLSILAVQKQVIQTKYVEFMPFYLSLSLTINEIMWFLYGIIMKDLNIYIPNVMGFSLGVPQMILYTIYKNGKKVKEQGLHTVEEKWQTEVSAKVCKTTRRWYSSLERCWLERPFLRSSDGLLSIKLLEVDFRSSTRAPLLALERFPKLLGVCILRSSEISCARATTSVLGVRILRLGEASCSLVV